MGLGVLLHASNIDRRGAARPLGADLRQNGYETRPSSSQRRGRRVAAAPTLLVCLFKDDFVSYLVLPDGTIQVSSEQEALALRMLLLGAAPDLATLQEILREQAAIIRSCQNELGCADPKELAGLIRKLRLTQPDDQLRIERNYWRTRSMELGEEVVIWQRRAGRHLQPTQEIFADLAAKVQAAASSYARELEASRAHASAARTAAAPPALPAGSPELVSESSAEEPESDVLSSRVELRRIREQLCLSQRAFAAKLEMNQARISQLERGGARVSDEVLIAARALLAARAALQESSEPRPVNEPEPQRKPTDRFTGLEDDDSDPDEVSSEDAYLED